MSSETRQSQRVLILSTIAFTLLFAVWMMFGVLGVTIQKELKLTDIQLAWLGAAAILAGSLPRLLFGVWAEIYGGRKTMALLLIATAIPTFCVSKANSFEQLLGCALLFGLAGNSFTVGISWNAAWAPKRSQGLVLGIFGAGNVGAAVTKLIFGLFGAILFAAIPASGLLGGIIPAGWRFYPVFYSILLVGMAALVWFVAPKPDRTPAKGRSLQSLLAPLGHLRVWEYSLQYVVVFGAYVALSLILPKFYVSVYGPSLQAYFGLPEGPEGATSLLRAASLLTTLFIFPASLLRPVGGWMSDRWEAKQVLWGVFAVMLIAGTLLSFPIGLNVWMFTFLIFVLGCGMGIGKAAVYKLIPNHFPSDVGAVGGMVGMLGALGGFVLPPTWAYLNQWTGAPQTSFGALTVLTAISACWFFVSQKSDEPAYAPAIEPTLEMAR